MRKKTVHAQLVHELAVVGTAPPTPTSRRPRNFSGNPDKFEPVAARRAARRRPPKVAWVVSVTMNTAAERAAHPRTTTIDGQHVSAAGP